MVVFDVFLKIFFWVLVTKDMFFTFYDITTLNSTYQAKLKAWEVYDMDDSFELEMNTDHASSRRCIIDAL